MASLAAAGGVDRGGGGSGWRSGCGLANRGDVTGVAEDTGGVGWSDAVQVEQTGPGLVEQFVQLDIGGLNLAIDCGQLGDQLGGELPAGLADHLARPDGGQQCLGLHGGEELFDAAEKQF